MAKYNLLNLLNIPLSLYRLFTETLHNYGTRNADSKLVIPAIHTFKYGEYSLRFQCAHNWNSSLTLLKTHLNNNMLYPNNGTRITTPLDLSRQQLKVNLAKILLS